MQSIVFLCETDKKRALLIGIDRGQFQRQFDDQTVVDIISHPETGFGRGVVIQSDTLGQDDRQSFNAGTHFRTVNAQTPVELQIIQGGEITAVGYFKSSLFIHFAHLDRSSQVFELVQSRMGFPVGPHDAVCTEIFVVGLITEITAVSPVFCSVRSCLGDAVIQPFPDKAALHPGKSFKSGKIIRQTAVAVAHGM
jgi:hypothetical protein